MSDQVKLQRMLEILMALSTDSTNTVEILAERFDVTTRTIYRYLKTFKKVGFKIVKTGNDIRISKRDSKFKDLSDLVHFTEEESIILSKAIHLVSDQNKYKGNLYEKLYYLFDDESMINQLLAIEHTDSALNIKEAIKNGVQVVVKDYSSSNSQSISDRLIEPFEFTPLYDSVWALDIKDQECKTFKIARMGKVILLPEKQDFTNRHIKKKIDVFRFSGSSLVKVSFTMTQTAYNIIIEEYPLSHQFITELTSNSYLFEGIISNFLGVGRFILGLMEEVQVNYPDELKDYLNTKISNKIF